MANITIGTSSQLQLSIPTRGTTGWDESLRTNTWLKIAQHDHSGVSGMGVAISTSALAADSVTGTKIRLDNDQYLRGRNAANSADINIIKVNSSDTLTLGAVLANPTFTTPTLGVASATTVNKVTITAPASGSTLTIADGKVLTASNTLTFTGTDSSSVAFSAGGTVAYVANKLSVFAATSSAELAGVISDETGSGLLVFNDTPTLATPVLGVATATSINKVALTAPASSATITIADGKTFTASNTLTFTGTDASSVAFGTGGTVTYTTNKLSAFAATTSAELAGVISNETGSGLLVFNDTATLIAPALGTPVSGTLTNCTALPRAGLVAGTAYHVLVNDASGVMTGVAPSTSGNVLTSNGTSWASATPSTAPDYSNQISNLGIALSVGAGALTIALKGKDGNDPSGSNAVKVGFRNATAATGTYTIVSTEGALSTVISSGSTAGFVSATTRYLYIYLINNAGTAELCWSASRFDEGTLKASTTEGGAGGADSGALLYATTGIAAAPIRLIGRVKFSLTTAGTWDEVGDEVSLAPFNDIPVVSVHTTNAGQSITTGSWQIINYEDVVKDSHGATVVGAAWKFTAPVAGEYDVSALATWNTLAAFATGEVMGIAIYVDGSEVISNSQVQSFTGAADAYGISITGIVSLTVGQYIDIRIFQSSGSSVALFAAGGNNRVNIKLIS